MKYLKFNILFVILCICILIDFIETVYGVGILGYYEMNPISRYIIKNKDWITFLAFALFLTPMYILGITHLFKIQWHRDALLLGFIIEYTYYISQNMYILFFHSFASF